MGEAQLSGRFWCYMCSEMVNPVMEVEIKCPYCLSGFVEEMEGRRDQETDLGINPTLSPWAQIFLNMMGTNPPPPREDQDQEQEQLESQLGESELDQEFESFLNRRIRRRRRSPGILNLLQTLRGVVASESENSETERETEQETERERVILINPFSRTMIIQGSFDASQSQSENRSDSGPFGEPDLEQLLQYLTENDPNRYGSPPTKKEAIEAMPTVKIGENLQCSVCLEDFEIGGEGKEMPCKHKFHGGCILPWLELHSSCPVCRFQMPTESITNTDGSGNSSNGGVGSNGGERGGEGGNGNGRWFRVSLPWRL